MEFEIKYLDRLESELRAKMKDKESLLSSKNLMPGLDAAFESVKDVCVQEVLRVKENNEDLAKYVESFSNGILTSLIEMKEAEGLDVEKIGTYIEVLAELISDTCAAKESVLVNSKQDIEKEREESVSPTARMARAALSDSKKKENKKDR